MFRSEVFEQLFKHHLTVGKTHITADPTNTTFFNKFIKKSKKPLFEHPQTPQRLVKNLFEHQKNK
jgi:hypothetical protein